MHQIKEAHREQEKLMNEVTDLIGVQLWRDLNTKPMSKIFT